MRIDFHGSPRPTLGVEVELTLVDRDSGALVSVASDLLAEMGELHADGVHPRAKHELLECTVEIVTDVCTTVAEARADLAATLDDLREHAARRDAVPLSVGTHPFSSWHDQQVSPDPRYHALIEEVQWPGRRLQIFGVHFHVGVRDGERAIAIANAMQTHLPVLLALSASSPCWEGHDTGLASARVKVFEGLPTAGLPPVIEDWPDFERFMASLIHAQAISTIREVWWDIRPHPGFGTIEVRICDAMPTLHEVAALAALTQSLVEDLDRRLDAGERLPVAREWIVRQNKWLAARHGLEATLLVDDAGDRQPLRELVPDLVQGLIPTADALGCADELVDVLTILDTGNGSDRQRALTAAGYAPEAVVAALVEELRTDTPGKCP